MGHDKEHAMDSTADHSACSDSTDHNCTTEKHGLMSKADKIKLDAVLSGGQQDQVIGTSDIANSSGAYADMTDMSITLTTTGGNVLLLFSTTINVDAQLATPRVRFDLDSDTQYHDQSWHFLYDQNNDEMPMAIQYLLKSLSAAEHTFKVQWYDESGTIGQKGTVHPRVFTAIEFPS